MTAFGAHCVSTVISSQDSSSQLQRPFYQGNVYKLQGLGFDILGWPLFNLLFHSKIILLWNTAHTKVSENAQLSNQETGCYRCPSDSFHFPSLTGSSIPNVVVILPLFFFFGSFYILKNTRFRLLLLKFIKTKWFGVLVWFGFFLTFLGIFFEIYPCRISL